MNRQRTIQVVAVGLSAIAVIAIIAVLTGGEIDETTARILGSVLTIAVYLVVGLAGNALRESGEPWSWLGTVAMTLCVLGALTACGLWWEIESDSGGDASDDWARAAGCFALFAVATAHGSLLVRHIGERSDAGVVARYLTFGLSLLIAAILSAAILDEDGSGEDLDPQLLAVLGILYGLGTIVSPLLRLGEGGGGDDAGDSG